MKIEIICKFIKRVIQYFSFPDRPIKGVVDLEKSMFFCTGLNLPSISPQIIIFIDDALEHKPLLNRVLVVIIYLVITYLKKKTP